MTRTLHVFLLLTLTLEAVFAANTGALKGYVKDPTGAVVPGVALALTSTDTGVAAKATADDNGFFQFFQLAPGNYELTATAAGFRKADVKNIVVLLDQIVSYDVRLEVGQVTETMEVQGGVAALIEPERISTGANITPSAVQSIPMQDRNFQNFWALTPGATTGAAGSQAGGTISTAGGRGGSMNQLIDGINNTDRQFGGPIVKYRIADAVREFSIISSAAGAELGRQAGAQVNVITKSGENRFHGSAFWFVRNDILQAKNFFTNKLNGAKPLLRQNQFGGTIGGPIRKDKTFFFYSWEAQHLNTPTVATAVVPTLADRASVLDPFAKNILAFYPLPNVPGAAAGTANFISNPQATNTDNTHLARFDHNFSDADRIAVRYIWFGGKSTNYGPLLTTGGTNSSPGAQQVMFSETHMFSPTFFAELRGGMSRDVTFILPQDYGFNAATVLKGVPGVYDASVSGPLESGLPQIAITGYNTVGRGGTSTPQELYVTTYDLLFNATKISPFGWSRHTFRFGGDIRREEAKRLNDGGASGVVAFSNFANFAGTCATCNGSALLNNSSILVGTSLSYWYRYPFAFYFSDDVKVKRNLTLNLGVRYEYPSAVLEKHDHGTNYIDGLGPVLLNSNKLLDIDPTKSGPSSIFYRTSPLTLPRSGTKSDKNNFAPVVGFAYTPNFSSGPGFLKDGKTVIRGGARVSYDETYNNVTINQSLGAPWNLTTNQRAGTTQPAAGYGWNLAFNQNVPFISRTTQAPGAPAVGLLGFNGLNYNNPTAYLYNWNFGVQREITSRASLDVSYIGSAGHKFGAYVNPNQARVVIHDPTFRGAQAPNEQFFPQPQFSSSRTADFQGNSVYNGLVITAKIHARAVDFVSAYTFSHSIDNSSSWAATTGDTSQPVDRFEMNKERGNSSTDQRHRLLNYFVFNLPFGRGKHFLTNAHGVVEQVVGGWQLAGVNTIYTGQPFTILANTSTDFSGFNTLLDRPDIVGTGALPMNYSDPDHMFDPAYFGKIGNGTNICPGYSAASGVRSATGCAPAGRVGTSPRDGYFGPGAINFDLTVAKKFPIHERLGLTYRAEFFNFTNHTNFLFSGNTRLMSSGQFGQMTSASPARVIQMTLRLDF